MNFQDLWNKCFLLFLGSCVIKKTCAFVVMGIEKKKAVGCRWDGQRSLGRQCPFLFVCVRVFVGWRVGWVSKIRHQMLLYKQNISNSHLSRSFALFNED